MTALIQDRKTDKLDTDDTVDARLVKYPVEAATSIWGGAMVAIDLLNNAVPAQAQVAGSATLAQLRIVGRCERQTLNLAVGGTVSPDGIGNGTAGSIKVPVRRGIFYYNINADSPAASLLFGSNLYASDDNTLSLLDGGGTRPYAGFVVDSQANQNPNATQVGALIGYANPYALSTLLSFASQFKCRNVVTSIQAYTGTGTNVLTETTAGAFAAQDGVTNAVGDIVFIQAGTTNLVGALDSGPWQITSLGAAGSQWVLTRPDWFVKGAVVAPGQVIDIDGEGTLWKGTQWKSFAAVGSAVIGTNDPAFYVGRVTQQVTFSASAFTLNNVGMLAAGKTGIEFLYTGTGAIAATVGYALSGALTPGYIGTATAPLVAVASGMAKNGTTDVSVVNVTVINW